MKTTWFHTEPLDIIDAPADAHHKGGVYEFVARRIVIHATGGVSSLDWLTWESSPPVSIHRLIDRDGRIYKLGRDDEVMYHIGFGSLFAHPIKRLINGNYTSLGIELENTNDGTQDYPPAQLESCVRQVVEWFGVFGYLPVVSHADLDARKRDPLDFPWNEFMVVVWHRIAGLVGDS